MLAPLTMELRERCNRAKWIAAALVAAVAFFGSTRAHAQITFVQKTPTATLIPSGAQTLSLNITAFSTQPVAGHFIVVFVTLDHNADIPTVRDNTAGNPAYTLAQSMAQTGGTALIYYRENITTVASFTVTVTTSLGTAQYMSAAAAEFSGVALSGSLEASPPTNSGTGTAVSTGAIVGTASSDLYIGVFTNNNNAYTSITSTAGTQLYNQPSNTVAAMGAEYLIGSGSQTLTWTTNPAYAWVAVGAAFKVAPPPPAAPVATAGTNIQATSFSANWNASSISRSGTMSRNFSTSPITRTRRALV